ncbi:hypothetical protein FA95DRAFT_1610239 [Auriscalpium vulgare]|uniref:Uncharacterized protein n=1 Tax=Auriscalpium vulgare TaxID=40419 RepID=A0ACB8RF95_9AGAM|nr:hypothetical protein FA95DRAFT_1610239 [Auriscalpium vulgare]
MFVIFFEKRVLPEVEKNWPSIKAALVTARRGDQLRHGRGTGTRLELGSRFRRDGRDVLLVAFKASRDA